jgi:hypothetical protein
VWDGGKRGEEVMKEKGTRKKRARKEKAIKNLLSLKKCCTDQRGTNT